jgi:exodeoxyribonuclease VII small subunit
MSGEEVPVEQMSFEQAMAELEAVVGRLEGGEVPLEDSIRLYERGAKLKAHCEAKLRAAEEKVEAIATDAAGQPAGTAPFDAG